MLIHFHPIFIVVHDLNKFSTTCYKAGGNACCVCLYMEMKSAAGVISSSQHWITLLDLIRCKTPSGCKQIADESATLRVNV